jgi:hypothetical protein
MTDYSKVVDALRCCSKHERRCLECEFLHNGYCSLQLDAADAIEELMKNLDMASQELSWTISYAMRLMRDIDELHDMVNEVYYDEL